MHLRQLVSIGSGSSFLMISGVAVTTLGFETTTVWGVPVEIWILGMVVAG